MEEVASSVSAAVPYAFILGLVGLLLKARLTGDPALWKRVEALEKKLEDQKKEFDAQLKKEREECAVHINKLSDEIEELRRLQSKYTLRDAPLGGALETAYRLETEEKDTDLLGELNRIPSTRGGPNGKEIRRTRSKGRSRRQSGPSGV